MIKEIPFLPASRSIQTKYNVENRTHIRQQKGTIVIALKLPRAMDKLKSC